MEKQKYTMFQVGDAASQDPTTSGWETRSTKWKDIPRVSKVDTTKNAQQDESTARRKSSQTVASEQSIFIAGNPGPATRDISPDVVITGFRTIKRTAPDPPTGPTAKPAKKRQSVSKAQAPKSKTNGTPVQKRESFDMNLIDPALRNVGLSSAQTFIGSGSSPRPTQTTTGIKRPAEGPGEAPVKRRKSSKAVPQSTETPMAQPSTDSQNPFSYQPSIVDPDEYQPWLPNTWSKQDYVKFAAAIDSTFGWFSFGQYMRKHPNEIQDVFRGIVIAPLLETTDALFPSQIHSPNYAAGIGEARMAKLKANEARLAALLAEEDAAKMKLLKERAMVEVGAEIRAQVQKETQQRLQAEGWVPMRTAKNLLESYERARETKSEGASPSSEFERGSLGGTSSSSLTGTGGSNVGKNKVLPRAEAEKQLIIANEVFLKSKKAEARKKALEERQARGEGSGKKLGRPKKNDAAGKGKGKGADFI